jgi:hypothetical protein
MKRILLLLVLITGVCFAFGLASDYSFTQSTQTYTEITGGTVVATGNQDDNQYAITLPFPFIFNETAVTTGAMCTNGYLTFGAGTSSFGYTAISSSTVGTGALAPMSRDLRGRADGEMRWEMFGTEPNRYVVYQWKNWTAYGSSYTNDNWNFQIILYETSNQIAYRYGPFTWVSTYSNSAEVGIRGATNADYKNRMTTTDWSATTAGTANSSTCTISSTIYPPNGLQFLFAPPVATLPPNPANLASPANGATVVPITATLNWTSGGGMPDGYYLYFGTDGGGTSTPTNIVNGTDLGNVNTYNPTPDMAYATTYYWQIVPWNANGSATGCPIWSFTTGPDPTISTFPYVENFDAVTAPAFPYGWTVIDNNADGDMWVTSTTYPNSSPNCARIYTDYNSTNDDYLVTPPVALTGNQQLKFWTRCYSTSEPDEISVLLSTTTPTAAAFTNVLMPTTAVNYATYTEYTLNLSAYSGTCYISFTRKDAPADGWYVHVDDITIMDIPAGAPDPVTLVAPASGSTSMPTAGFDLEWTPALTGGLPLYYSVYLSHDEDPINNNEVYFETSLTSLNPATFALGPDDPIAFAFGDRWYWTVVANNNDGASDPATAFWFETQSENEVTIGDGTGIGLVPVYPWYTYTYSQSIYLQSEINRAGKQIESIKWYWNGYSAISEPNIDIYMGHTAQTDLVGGMLPISGMQLVYSGPYSVPATPGWIEFPLTSPFIYNNTDNLVIAANENGGPSSTYYSSSNGFFMTATTTSRSSYMYNDSSPYDPTTATGGSPYAYIPNVFLTMGDVPTEPVYAINPGDWNYGDVEQLNPSIKQYTITNVGVGTITINAGDIYIDPASDVEGNFAVSATGLPVSLGAGQSYYFNVTFTPQTTGAKTASLKVEDNLAARVLHTYALSGNGITEQIGTVIGLQASVQNINDVNLSWSLWNGAATPNSWIFYCGDQADAIGTGGAADFSVAAKFPSGVMGLFAGDQLTTVRFFPYVDGTSATYTIRLWTGTDDILAPSGAPVYEQAVPTFTTNAWNDVALTTPYNIVGTEALYIGYHVVTTAGYPAGCDAGPQVAGFGNLIEWNSAWSELTALNSALTYNWCIEGYVASAPIMSYANRNYIQAPVIAQPKTSVQNFGQLTSALGTVTQPERAIQGFNVYRNNVQINTGLVTGFTYQDADVAAGSYDYNVEAVYYTQTTPMSNTASVVIYGTDMAAIAIGGSTWGMFGDALSYDITVLNNGVNTQSAYTVKLLSDTDVELATMDVTTPLDMGLTATHTLSWTPATSGSWLVHGKVIVAGDQNLVNDATGDYSVTVYSADAFIPQIGDFASTNSTNILPINVYWMNSVSETIYLPQELQMTSGTIQAIMYQNNFTQNIDKPIRVWMKHTTEANVGTAWLASADYTLVFEGSIHFPMGVNTVVVPLDTPFNYTGGNLAIRVYEVWEGMYYNSDNYFYYTDSTEYPSRSRYYYVDGSGPIDPLTMLDYDGNAYTGTATSWTPNTALIVDPATPVTALATPVVTATIVGGNVQLDWPVVAGAYAYRIYEADDPYGTWPVDPIATVHTNTYTIASNPYKFYKVVAITTYRETDLGIVTNPASAIGFDNSKVKVVPTIPQTNRKN